MPVKRSSLLLVVHLLAAFGVAHTAELNDVEISRSPGALSGWWAADDESITAYVGSRLTSRMSVAVHGDFVVAASDSMAGTLQKARRIAAYDAEIRRRYFPALDHRRMLVIIGDDAFELQRLTNDLYPNMTLPNRAASGFYHHTDRLILASAEFGDGALRRELTRALVQDDNPSIPRWFEDAMATLYESSEWRTSRLTPMLDGRMAQIAPQEDLAYDVFAGICDCSEVTAEQLALIRLLLVHLHERGELVSLYDAIKRQGQYVTLLQALEAIDLDERAWKAYAERHVREFWKMRGEVS